MGDPNPQRAGKENNVDMFNHDWFHGPAFEEQQQEAVLRCGATHFPDLPPEKHEKDKEFRKFCEELEVRILIYLRDGFSYEVKQIADVSSKSHLVFECMPVDEHYKVGAFVVSLPFDEIVRVEIFAVHPSEKPEDIPLITGFRGGPDQVDGKHSEASTHKAR
jgi:hypothetical protein